MEPRMNAGIQLKHQALTGRVIGVFLEVYNELGAGFLESVYVNALAMALSQAGLSVQREMPLAVRFRGSTVGDFRADLVVGGKVLVETKACPSLISAHSAQVLNYLRATILEVGLLLNFGPKPSIKRFVFDNCRKRPLRCDPSSSCAHPRPFTASLAPRD
ncbi:MAG TPA: GxxExxY protein [Gemmatimonadales bacterium]